MNLQFTLFDLLLLLGIVQGLITSTLLLLSDKNKRSNRFLGLALVAFSLLCTKPLLHSLNLWDLKYFRYFPNGLELSLPPLLYFYVVALTDSSFRFKKKDYLHFIPFFMAQLYAFWVYFSALNYDSMAGKNAVARQLKFDEIKTWEEYVLLISFMIYLYLGYRKIGEYKSWLDQYISDTSFPELKWLQNLYRLFAALLLFLLVNHGLDVFFDLNDSTIIHWNLFILTIACCIYFLGFKGLLLPDLLVQREQHLDSISPHTNTVDQNVIKQIQHVMEKEQLYLNPELTLKQLAIETKISPKALSQNINNHFETNFRDFVNIYRIEEVKSRLRKKDQGHLSLLGIAYESGFKSEASFYRLFKKYTGTTPNQFVKQEIQD